MRNSLHHCYYVPVAAITVVSVSTRNGLLLQRAVADELRGARRRRTGTPKQTTGSFLRPASKAVVCNNAGRHASLHNVATEPFRRCILTSLKPRRAAMRLSAPRSGSDRTRSHVGASGYGKERERREEGWCAEMKVTREARPILLSSFCPCSRSYSVNHWTTTTTSISADAVFFCRVP